MMNKIFIDSNVIIYAHTTQDLTKQVKAQSLIHTHRPFISTQVLHECTNGFSRKFKMTWVEIEEVLDTVKHNCRYHRNDFSTVSLAIKVASSYSYSFYDSLIVAAALEADCTILYSEDMHDGHIINGTLTIRNPFL